MKRKLMLLGLVISLMIAMAIPALALSDDRLDFITDELGVLTDNQRQELQQQASEISREYDCGVYVVIVHDYAQYGSTIIAANGAIYDNNALGWGPAQDGVMLLLSMAERDYYLRAYGDWGRYAFSFDGLDLLADSFLDDFGDDDWYAGIDHYLQECEHFMEAALQGEPMDEETDLVFSLLMILGLPLLVALVVCLIMKAQLKSVRKKTGAMEYMRLDESTLRIREDRFTHTTEVRRKIERSSSGSGSSGRGGKF